MASNYTGNPTATQAPGPLPAPATAPVISIPAGTDVRTIESITQAMKESADFIAFLNQQGRGTFYDDHFGRGTGADGNQASGFGTISWTRDMEYNNLSMSSTDIINTNGFLPRVRGTFTAAAGAIFNVPAATTSFNGTVGCGALGGAAQTAGTAAIGLGGNGGAGGNVGGSGGTNGLVTAPTWAWRNPPACFAGGQSLGYKSGVLSMLGVQGGAGGGGGGNNGNTGGAGGGGGGVFWIICEIVNGTFTVNVNGGTGSAGVGGNANGGGGGGGGAAVIVYGQRVLLAATVNAAGGGGGAASGTGGAGTSGSAGNSTIIEIAL